MTALLRSLALLVSALVCLGCSAHHVVPDGRAAQLNDADWEIIREPSSEAAGESR